MRVGVDEEGEVPCPFRFPRPSSAISTCVVERGDYGQFLADDAELSIAGTDQQAHGREGVVQMIRFFHEIAFDAQPEFAA